MLQFILLPLKDSWANEEKCNWVMVIVGRDAIDLCVHLCVKLSVFLCDEVSGKELFDWMWVTWVYFSLSCCVYVCVCACSPCALAGIGQKTVLCTSELELQVIEPRDLGAGTQTGVLWKSISALWSWLPRRCICVLMQITDVFEMFRNTILFPHNNLWGTQVFLTLTVFDTAFVPVC